MRIRASVGWQWAVWALLFLGAALANVAVAWLEAVQDGKRFDPGPELLFQLTSIVVSLCLLPLLLAACQRWPLHLDTWRRRLPAYLAGAVLWWLLHVSGMVVLRQLVLAAMGTSYSFGGTLSHWLYELVKDAQTVFLLVWAAHAAAWYERARQGEAQLLAPADDAGLAGVPESRPVEERPAQFLVRKLGKDFLVATADIEYAQANGNYVNLHVRGHVYPLRSTMAALRGKLDPAVFLSTHRSWLVNRHFLVAIEPQDGGEAMLLMRDGAQVPCSRRQLPDLRQALAGTGA